MPIRNLFKFIAITLAALVVGCAISFAMLGFRPQSETAIYAVAISLEVGSQVFGAIIRDAVPEGGPAAFVALHMLTFTAIWSFAIFMFVWTYRWFGPRRLSWTPRS